MTAFTDTKTAAPCFTFRRSCINSQNIIASLLCDIYNWLEQIDVQHGTITNVQIALAEALSNIIEHGFEDSESGTIELEIKVRNSAIVVHISDNGVEFTPPNNTRTPLQDIEDIDSLPEGGFGWFLINEITSSYIFRRVSKKNHLILNF